MLLSAILTTMVGTTYFVDPVRGDDAFPGTSVRRAWKTVGPAAKRTFGPGDRLLLAGGQRVLGPLTLSGPNGLTIGAYGVGRAALDGGSGSGIVIEGARNLRIEDLVVVGDGRKANDGNGIAILQSSGVVVAKVEVRGFRLAGVDVVGSSDVRLSAVVAQDNGSTGISVNGGYDTVPRSANIVIRDCRAIGNLGDPKNLDNHSGNGIVVGGVDGCLIEYCEAAENGAEMPRDGNGPVGIWAWNASRVTIQNCISHHNRSPGLDGGGFDLDGGVTDSIIQNCLSYGNVGVGYLLCQYGGGGLWKNNVFRNNISYEDGTKNGPAGIALYIPPGMSNMEGALVERNTIIHSKYAAVTSGDLPGITYKRNVFLAGVEVMKVPWGEGGFRNSRFDRNLAWGRRGGRPNLGDPGIFSSPDTWATSGGRSVDPKLRLPSSLADLPTDPRQLAKMPWFVPASDSPCCVGGKVAFGAAIGS